MSFLHSITGGAFDFELCLLQPDISRGLRVTSSFSTLIAEGMSGIEGRAPEHADMRHEMTLSFQLSPTEAAEFRTSLLTLGEIRLAVPFWIDAMKPASAAAIFSGGYTVNFNETSGAYAINSSAGHPRTSSLLIGRLKARPRLRAVDQTHSIVEITIIEDSPIAAKVDANTLAMSSWSLAPNWAEQVEDFTQWRIQTTDLGQGREGAVSGQESTTRRGQAASFMLTRDEARQLLTFFAAKKGAVTSFSLPLWYQPGGAETMTARFAGDSVTVEWLSTTSARVALEFIEEVPLISGLPDQAQPGRAWLYKFTFEGSSAVGYTSAPDSLTFDSLTYAPQKIQHGNFTQSIRPQGDDIDIECDGFAGCPLEVLAKLELERKLLLDVYECDPATPSGAQLIFSGQVMTAQIKGRRLVGSASTLGGALRRKVPRFLVQRTCNYSLYDSLCGVSAATYKVTGTMASATGNTIDVTCGSAAAADYFANGWVLVGSGSTAERRAILRSVAITGGQRLTVHKPIRQGGTPAVEFYPGCDGQFESTAGCARYSNQNRFGGAPRQPAFIETVATGYAPKLGK
jgi:hypothetical protein